MSNRIWSLDELTVAFDLYTRTPFGRLSHTNPDMVELAAVLGRTPSSVSMKCCNFAAVDPQHRARGVKGLSGASRNDRLVFEEFSMDLVKLADAAEGARRRMLAAGPGGAASAGLVVEEREETGRAEADWLRRFEPGLVSGPTAVPRLVQVRRVQGIFRRAVVAAYDVRCAVCELAVPGLLRAAHIIPWAADAARRADPSNGLALCALHEPAFDLGLFTVTEELAVRVSPSVRGKGSGRKKVGAVHQAGLIDIDGRPVARPTRFPPAAEALRYHRERVFAA